MNSRTQSTPRIAQPGPVASEVERAVWQREREAVLALRDRIANNPTTAAVHGGDGDLWCDECLGIGWLRTGDGQLVPCECTAPKRAARLDAISGLLPNERLVTFADIVGDPAQGIAARMREFVLAGRGWFTVYGGPGNAKTTMLQAACNLYREQFRDVAVYVRFADLLEWVRDGFNEDAPSERASARLEQIKTASVLAIDEFEKINTTKWAEEVRFRLLDDRYRYGLDGSARTLTLFAMNCAPEALPEWVSSRMRDGRFVCVENAQPDARPRLRME